jgi:hypothetical protein
MNILRYMPVMLVVALCPTIAAPLHADAAARYEAVFSDGTRLEGERITGWDRHPGAPRLDNAPLVDKKRPLRWLRDRSLRPWSMPADCGGFIEFVTGDRIVGQVTGSRPSSTADGVRTPAHLLVMPIERLDATSYSRQPTPVRVLAGSIRRIVMKPTPGGLRYQPGTMFYRDGRRVAFASLRLGQDRLRLLLSDGTLNVKFADVAEVHFPRIDSWEAYFRELGILSPACRSRLIRFETTGGLIATASELRFHAVPYPSLEYHQRIMSQIKRLDTHVMRLQKREEQRQKRFDQMRADYARQSDELEKRLKAARQAYQHAKANPQRRTDPRRKRNPGRLSRELQNLKRMEAEHRIRSGYLKKRIEHTIAQWQRRSSSIDQIRAQRDAARAHSGSGSWRHIIQPAWSLDALWVPFGGICMRWSFPPDRLPLSRMYPTASVNPALQPWCLNRNSRGQLLRSGGQQYGWGFGVHAYSELAFTLPQCATSFRSRLGLDRIVDTGGCARARIFLNSTTEKPLYASGLLIGSKKTVDTGPIAIGTPAKGPKRLILQADMAHRNRPSGTDPLNIRDKLDWLEPVIGFDPTGLQKAVDRKIVDQKDAWKGWTVKFDKRGGYSWASRFQKDRPTERGSFRTMLRAGKHPLVLSRSITVGPDDNWLTVDVDRSTAIGTSRPVAASLRIDNKEIKPEKPPIRQAWQGRDAPTLFPIKQYRRKKVTLELTQPAGSTEVVGHTVGLSGELPQEYRIATALKKVMALRDAAPLPAKWGQGARDLLKSVNPAEDAVHGKWTKPGGQLLSDWRTNARCQLSAGSQGSYQLDIQFTRIAGDCMAVMLPVGRTGVLLVVSGWGGEVSGLAYINRKDADRNETTRAGKLENGVKHTLLITTRLLKGNRARIDVTLNGKPYIKWEGLASALLPDGAWRLRDPKLFGLGAYSAIIIFHSCQFKAINDR